MADRINWSWAPIQALLDALGRPERHFQVVHIGGTNGKGSVAVMVYQALREAGHRVALYTSPHLIDLRERMIVDDRPVAASALAMWTERLRPIIEATGASFFDSTTAIAFADFAARGADVAIVEVGMGGRLDTTNVLQPLASAVTTVARDHGAYLGDSLEQVAWEKAGIAKPGTPFVIGEPTAPLAALLRRYAEQRGAAVIQVPAGESYGLPVGLAGDHQRRNAAVAVRLLRALPVPWRPPEDAVRRGLAAAWVPGRFDRRGKWLFDVAHNLPAVETLAAITRAARLPRPLHALVGILRDKDWQRMVDVIRSLADRLWLVTAPTVEPARRWDLESVRSFAHDAVATEDFDAALDDAQRGAATVLVTGSFYTVGYALSRLPGFQPLG